MFNRKYFLKLCIAVVMVSSSAFAVEIGELYDALIQKKLFNSAISEVAVVDKDIWRFKVGGEKYTIQKGRPDNLWGTVKSFLEWERFVGKITVKKQDYTVFKHDVKSKWDGTCLNYTEIRLWDDVRRFRFERIEKCLESKKIIKCMSKRMVDCLLEYVWNKDYQVKAAASFALALLGKYKKLDDYVYRAWSAAVGEENYTYHSKPLWSEHCSSYIRQLGMYEVAKGKKKGFVIATCLPNSIANAVFRRTISEEFFIISGEGEFWKKDAKTEVGPLKVRSGDFVSNPKNMHIQFRNTGDKPLKMLVTTDPPFDTSY